MENNRVLASVAGQSITENEVEAAASRMSSARGRNFNTPEGRQAVLEQLIVQKLFLADARRSMLEYDPQFKAQLAQVKDELLYQFAVTKALEKVKVTEEEIKQFYDENPDQFMGEPTVSASHILVDSEEKAQELLAAIKNGEITFEDAAMQHSSCPSKARGGSLGQFGHGQMVPEFDAVCFAMEVGAIEGPVKTQFGYHLIRLDGKQEAAPVSLQDAHDMIHEHLMAEKSQKAYQSRINQLKLVYPVDR